MTARRRGRPRKNNIFLDKKAPVFPKRPLSDFAKVMLEASAAHDKKLKKHKLYGPHIGVAIIQELEWADMGALPIPPLTAKQIEDAHKMRAQHGTDGGAINRTAPVWKNIMTAQREMIFSRMAKGNSASSVCKDIRRNWTKVGGFGEPPSERTLRRWVAENELAKTLRPKK